MRALTWSALIFETCLLVLAEKAKLMAIIIAKDNIPKVKSSAEPFSFLLLMRFIKPPDYSLLNEDNLGEGPCLFKNLLLLSQFIIRRTKVSS